MSASLRIDTSELIAGALVIGETGLGVLGGVVPSSGEYGPSCLYSSLSLPADASTEIRGLVIATPSAGVLFIWEDGSFTLTGAPDGAYTFTIRVYAAGVDLGAAVVSMSIGALASALSGALTLADIVVLGNAYGTSVLLQDIQALLITLAPAGGVFYGLNTTEPPAYPYIVWQRIASTANVALGGSSAMQNTRIQVDIMSRTIAEVASIETALEAAFAASSIVNVPISSQDIYEDLVRAFHVMKEYSIWATN